MTFSVHRQIRAEMRQGLAWQKLALISDDQSNERRGDFDIEAKMTVAFCLVRLSAREKKSGQGNAKARPPARNEIQPVFFDHEGQRDADRPEALDH